MFGVKNKDADEDFDLIIEYLLRAIENDKDLIRFALRTLSANQDPGKLICPRETRMIINRQSLK